MMMAMMMAMMIAMMNDDGNDDGNDDFGQGAGGEGRWPPLSYDLPSLPLVAKMPTMMMMMMKNTRIMTIVLSIPMVVLECFI